MRKIVYFKENMLDIPDPDFAKLIFMTLFSIQRSHSGIGGFRELGIERVQLFIS